MRISHADLSAAADILMNYHIIAYRAGHLQGFLTFESCLR